MWPEESFLSSIEYLRNVFSQSKRLLKEISLRPAIRIIASDVIIVLIPDENVRRTRKIGKRRKRRANWVVTRIDVAGLDAQDLVLLTRTGKNVFPVVALTKKLCFV
jgi:hypothetical protein